MTAQTTPSSSPLPPNPPEIDYVGRWAAIVERRRVQMDAAYAEAGLEHVDYWGRRAVAFRNATHARTEEDPFLVRVRDAVTPASTLLDVGAGTGRHTLALARHVGHITAVDPSAAMLGLLREDLAARTIENVTTVQAEWMSADVEPADFVICSHVLYPIADVVPFIRKLESSARERVFVYLRADPLATDFGLWSAFHGVPLQPQPAHVDLFNVLAQVGIFADVEIVSMPLTWTFETRAEAVQQVANSLCLRDDDHDARTKLAALLDERMVPLPNGRLGSTAAATRSAIFSWRPR
ncbi:MAG: class I SAM-dependent methyltransferase [Chloroflexota bacterium]|nr:class I SAM-dependent methyltransferase [Chloroflexota bacterium]